MPRRDRLPSARFVVVCLWVLLLGLALGLYKVHFPPGPVADEATYVMMTQSLWHDYDLRYTITDLHRAYRIWDHGPHGLILFTTDGGETMYYGKPYVYSLMALPFLPSLTRSGSMSSSFLSRRSQRTTMSPHIHPAIPGAAAMLLEIMKF